MLFVLCAVFVQGCTLIDDDLSNCGYDYMLRYKMQLKTKMQTSLEEQLPADVDAPARQAITDHLSPVFSDVAHDLDLWFYSGESDQVVYSRHENIEKSEAEFTFYLPVENYLHVASANIRDNAVVVLTDTASSASALMQVELPNENIPCQKTGLYAEGLPISVADTVGNHVFEVELTMVNSAVALVIDTIDCPVGEIDVVLTGTADGYRMYSDEYVFDKERVVVADKVEIQSASPAPAHYKLSAETMAAETKQVCYTMVSFPSKESSSSWSVKVYAHMSDGSVTETVLTPVSPLGAGELVVLKAQMDTEGRVHIVCDAEVGAVFKLDWKEGGVHDL